jgi:GST-like protein
MIDLHYVGTPNGSKVSIMLEEISLPYKRIDYNLLAGDHLVPEFRRINPNNKLPAIVDRDPADGKGPLTVFESGAVLIYLAEKTGQLLSTDFRRRTLTLQWLMWQMAGVGPMNGQAHHFVRYAPEDQIYGVTRYTNEVRRLLGVMEYRLNEAEYLAEDYSIADIACWPWITISHIVDVDLAEFPAVKRWADAVGKRKAVIDATASEEAVPERFYRKRMELTAEEWSNIFGDHFLDAAKPK